MSGDRKSVWQFIILTNNEKHKNYFLSYDTLSLQKVITDLKPSDDNNNNNDRLTAFDPGQPG